MNAEKPLRLSRAQRAAVQRLTNTLITIERHEFPSSSSNRIYHTVIHADGKVLCDCRGWTMKKEGKARWCRHTDEVIGSRVVRDDGEFLFLVLGP